jgi:hypothetical protein
MRCKYSRIGLLRPVVIAALDIPPRAASKAPLFHWDYSSSGQAVRDAPLLLRFCRSDARYSTVNCWNVFGLVPGGEGPLGWIAMLSVTPLFSTVPITFRLKQRRLRIQAPSDPRNARRAGETQRCGSACRPSGRRSSRNSCTSDEP